MSETSTNNKRTRESATVNASSEEDGIPPIPQRRKTVSLTDDLVCPITLELPFDPVTAQDGCVYEQSAIETHIQTCQARGTAVKSPLTNMPMGPGLFPAPLINKHIQVLIDNDLVEDSLSSPWKQKADEQERAEKRLKMAESGNTEAMVRVSESYFAGTHGFKKDLKLSYKWSQKAHEAGNITGTLLVGCHLIHGGGVEKNATQGLVFLGLAAGKGLDYAAYHLGLMFTDGMYGLSKNPKEAIRWLQKSLSPSGINCAFLDNKWKDDAEQKLQELMNEVSQG